MIQFDMFNFKSNYFENFLFTDGMLCNAKLLSWLEFNITNYTGQHKIWWQVNLIYIGYFSVAESESDITF